MDVATILAEVRSLAPGKSKVPKIGVAKGQFTVPNDFNAPLPADVLQAFEGK